jgi:hypothetical protein
MSAPSTAAGVAATVAACAAVAAAVLVAQTDQGKEVTHAVQEDIHRALAPPSLHEKADSAAAAVGDLAHSTRGAIEDAAHAAAASAAATVHKATGPPSLHHTSLFSDSPLVRVSCGRVGRGVCSLARAGSFLPPPRTHSAPPFCRPLQAGVTAEDLHFPAPGAVARAKTTTTPHPF